MVVYNKDFIVSLAFVVQERDNDFKLTHKGMFDKEHAWMYKGKKIEPKDFKKTHIFNDSEAFTKAYVKISFVNGDVIRVYKNSNNEGQEYYKKLLQNIKNPLFL